MLEGLAAIRRTVAAAGLDAEWLAARTALAPVLDPDEPVPADNRFWLWAGMDVTPAGTTVKAYASLLAGHPPGWRHRLDAVLDALHAPADCPARSIVRLLGTTAWGHEVGIGVTRGGWGAKIYFETHGFRPNLVAEALRAAGLSDDIGPMTPEIPGVLRASLAERSRAGIALRVVPDTGAVTEVTVACAFPPPLVGRGRGSRAGAALAGRPRCRRTARGGGRHAATPLGERSPGGATPQPVHPVPVAAAGRNQGLPAFDWLHRPSCGIDLKQTRGDSDSKTRNGMLLLEDHWVWDTWMADDGDAYHLFFLQAPRSLGPRQRHKRATVGHATSPDLVTGTYQGAVLGPGAGGLGTTWRSGPDRSCATATASGGCSTPRCPLRAAARSTSGSGRRVRRPAPPGGGRPDRPARSTAAGTRKSPTPRPDQGRTSRARARPGATRWSSPTPMVTAGTC